MSRYTVAEDEEDDDDQNGDDEPYEEEDAPAPRGRGPGRNALTERDMPDPADQDDHDDPELVPCPYCGAPISEDAEICPRCHSFISIEDAPPRKSWLVIAGAIAALAGVTGAGWFLMRWW